MHTDTKRALARWSNICCFLCQWKAGTVLQSHSQCPNSIFSCPFRPPLAAVRSAPCMHGSCAWRQNSMYNVEAHNWDFLSVSSHPGSSDLF